MVNATVVWAEHNANATENVAIQGGFSHWGNTAAASLDPNAYPITPGSISYEKWQYLLATLNDATKISAVKFWKTGAAEPANTTLRTNASEGAFANLTLASWRAPAATADLFIQDMPTATPGGANIGIGGDTLASLTGATGFSDYIVHGIVTAAGALAGPGSAYTLHMGWDEVR